MIPTDNRAASIAWRLFLASVVAAIVLLATSHLPRSLRRGFIDFSMLSMLVFPIFIALVPATLVAGVMSLFRPRHTRGIVAIVGILALAAGIGVMIAQEE